jgi:hypothetical protein
MIHSPQLLRSHTSLLLSHVSEKNKKTHSLCSTQEKEWKKREKEREKVC